MSATSPSLNPYLEVELKAIRPNVAVPCAIHIFLKTNQHVLKWKNSGDEATPESLQKLARAGITQAFILKADEPKWKAYLNPPKPAPTPEAVAIVAAMKAPEMPPKKKAEIAAPIAKAAIQASLVAETLPEQRAVEAKNRKLIQDVLQETVSTSAQLAAQIFQNSPDDLPLSHGLNVATYATLFALAFGKIDPQVVGDLALAALIHDIGVTQLPLSYSQLRQPHKNENYRKHVDAGIELAAAIFPDFTPRIRTLMQQHHEKFDGSGYPQRLQSFAFDDIAQLLAMANLLDEFSNGTFNGEIYASKDALIELEKIEKSRNFPEYFNPEVFNAVLKWTRKESNQELIARASNVVSDKADDLVHASGPNGKKAA